MASTPPSAAEEPPSPQEQLQALADTHAQRWEDQQAHQRALAGPRPLIQVIGATHTPQDQQGAGASAAQASAADAPTAAAAAAGGAQAAPPTGDADAPNDANTSPPRAPALPRERLDVPPPAPAAASSTGRPAHPASDASDTGTAAAHSSHGPDVEMATSATASFEPVDASATVAAAAQAAAAGDGIQVSLSAPTYGFADRYQGVLGALMSEIPDVMDLPSPDDTPAAARDELRNKAEEADFDAARYAADAIDGGDDPLASAAYAMQPAWREAAAVVSEGGEAPWGGFTDAENEALASLPRTEYLLEDGTHDQHRMLCVLGGIMFASAYDFRLSAGDGTVESAWTLCKLSPALSWLEGGLGAQETLHACVRRAVTYGYMRSWKMARLAAADSALLLRCGRRHVLRQLLWTRAQLERHDTKYVANRLWLNDLCVWVQTLSDARVASFAAEWAGHVKALTPASTGWNLKRIVQDAVASLQDSDDETSDEDDSDDSDDDDSDDDDSSVDDDGREDSGDADSDAPDSQGAAADAGASQGAAADAGASQGAAADAGASQGAAADAGASQGAAADAGASQGAAAGEQATVADDAPAQVGSSSEAAAAAPSPDGVAAQGATRGDGDQDEGPPCDAATGGAPSEPVAADELD